MQINLLNMYKLDLQTHILWDTEKQVILLSQLHSYWFRWIIQAWQGSDAKIEKIAVHLKSNMIMMIHTWKVIHNLASKASLYFNKKDDQYNITQ